MLFEGAYDGYFQAGRALHSPEKGFEQRGRGAPEVPRRAYCPRVTANAYELAMTEFRYDRLIGIFADTLADSI